MKIGLFLPNWIGDAVMATPALRAIRTHFSNAEIIAVLRPYVADVLAGLDLVDRVLLHDPRGADPHRRGRRFLRALRCERLDLAVLFPNSLRSAAIAWMAGAKRRVGIARNGRRLLLTDAIAPRPRKQPHPVIDEYLRIAERLGCTRLTRTMELAVLPEDEEQLRAFWAGHDRTLPARGVVCLNPGGAFGSAKHWPSESFARLARRIVSELGKTVLVLCGPAERSEASEIVRLAADKRVVSLADVPLSLGLTKAAIRSAELLVTTDSGPRHFAPPFGVPVVTLFGPTHIEWSETFYPRAVHVQLEVDCGPCQQRVCPLVHHRCMRELTPDRVYANVLEALRRARSQRAAWCRDGLAAG
jgi:heptosyltransferase-2